MKKAREVLGEAIGEASMCWSEIPKGIFESDRASKIVDHALLALQDCLPTENESARNIVKRFSLICDAELSLADIQWLTKNITKALADCREALKGEK